MKKQLAILLATGVILSTLSFNVVKACTDRSSDGLSGSFSNSVLFTTGYSLPSGGDYRVSIQNDFKDYYRGNGRGVVKLNWIQDNAGEPVSVSVTAKAINSDGVDRSGPVYVKSVASGGYEKNLPNISMASGHDYYLSLANNTNTSTWEWASASFCFK